MRPKRTILCVDDNEQALSIRKLMLETRGYRVLACSNGHQALDAFKQGGVDLVLSDLQMPGLDGFEVCAKIRQTELNRTTPVVFVTCHNDFSAHAKSTAAGGQDLLGKPFLTFELGLKALTLVLQRRLQPDAPAESEAAEPQLAEAVG